MAAKYLRHFPKPLLDDLVAGRWLPIVGAGMSLNAYVASGKRPPLWTDLGKQLEKDIADFSSNSPIDAISAYEHEFGRSKLVERLIDILLIREASPGIAHKEFCSIPFDIVCTTNFDFLLEKQYDLTPRYVYPVVDEDQLSVDASQTGTLLLKIHGDVQHPTRMVLSEADYDGFLTNFPLLATYFSNLLITKTAVLIGYSLEDADFRQIWHVVTQRLGKSRRNAYVILIGAKSSDIARYNRRGVKVIDLPGSKKNYGAILATVFAELREYIRDNILQISTVTEEEPLREIQLPRTSSSRLCYFSMPANLLSYYKEHVFPAVESAGLVPLSSDDVLTPGSSIVAKVDALIDRATVMVIDLSSDQTKAEFDTALAKLKSGHDEQFRLIVVASRGQTIQEGIGSVEIVYRDDLWSIDPENFVQELLLKLDHNSNQRLYSSLMESHRLFDIGAHKAAVISAIILLESTLRKVLNLKQWDRTRRPMSLRNLVRRAVEAQIISSDYQSQIDRWITIRNEIVHTDMSISPNEARRIVNGVEQLVANILNQY